MIAFSGSTVRSMQSHDMLAKHRTSQSLQTSCLKACLYLCGTCYCGFKQLQKWAERVTKLNHAPSRGCSRRVQYECLTESCLLPSEIVTFPCMFWHFNADIKMLVRWWCSDRIRNDWLDSPHLTVTEPSARTMKSCLPSALENLCRLLFYGNLVLREGGRKANM